MLKRNNVVMNCPTDQQLHSFLSDEVVAHDIEIGDHIDGCDTCQSRLDILTADCSVTPSKSELPSYLSGLESRLAVADSSSAPPTPELSGYEILNVLGRGGMGVVYRARHLRLDREIALKVVVAGAHASPEYRERLNREGQLLAKLNHPGIVRIFDGGEHEGLPYLALELMTHGNLAERRDQFREPKVAVRLIELLARASGVAHQKGIVHRDLKPANIMFEHGDNEVAVAQEHCIELNGERLVPKIADFGLSKATQNEGLTDISVSRATAGTPQYMSPEQATEQVDRIGPATDIHALGVMLYELLTGIRPFDASGSLNILQRIRSHTPEPPSSHNSRVDRTLDAIVLKCLEKEPANRFESAQALADELERHRTSPPEAKRVRSKGRRRFLVALASVVALLLAGILIELQTKDGLIVVQCDDPDLKITVKRNDEEVESFQVLEGTKELTVKAGTVEIGLPTVLADKFVVSESSFELIHNDKKMVTIRRRPRQPQERKPEPITQEASTKRKKETPNWAEMNQSQIADWILKRKDDYKVQLRLSSHPHYQCNIHQLPNEHVVVSEVTHLRFLTSEEFKLFEYLPEIRKVGATFGKYRGDSIASLNRCRKLTWLNLNACRLTDEELAHLDVARLQYLGLTHNAKLTAAILPQLAAASNLRHLVVDGRITKADEAATWFPRMGQVRSIDVYSQSEESWKHLSKLPNLKSFFCFGTKGITDAGLTSLVRCMKLESMKFDRSDLGKADLKKLTELKKLKNIWFNHCELGDNTRARLKELFPNCRVTQGMQLKQ